MEQYFHVVLFIILYKVVLTFKSVDETLVCDHSNESHWAVLSCGTVYYAVQGGSNFKVHRWDTDLIKCQHTMIVYSKHAISLKVSSPRTSAQESSETLLPVFSELHDVSVKCRSVRLHLIQQLFSKCTIGRIFTMATNRLVSNLAWGICKWKNPQVKRVNYINMVPWCILPRPPRRKERFRRVWILYWKHRSRSDPQIISEFTIKKSTFWKNNFLRANLRCWDVTRCKIWRLTRNSVWFICCFGVWLK